VSTVGHGSFHSHDGIFLPGNNVGNADGDNKLTPGAGVFLFGPFLANRLNDKSFTAFRFPTPKTCSEAFNAFRKIVVAGGTSVTAGH
jgi:hypothetical protein